MMGIGFVGFFAGMMLFTSVVRWVGTVYEIINDPTRAGSRGKGLRVALATVLGSGPWLLVVAIGGAYFIRAESWAPPLIVGAIIAVVFLSGLSIWVARR